MERLLELDGVVLEDLQADDEPDDEPEPVDLQALLTAPVAARTDGPAPAAPEVPVVAASGVDSPVEPDAQDEDATPAGDAPREADEPARPAFSHEEPTPVREAAPSRVPVVTFAPPPEPPAEP